MGAAHTHRGDPLCTAAGRRCMRGAANVPPPPVRARSLHCAYVIALAAHAPTCTIGPSGPIGSPAATEQIVPTIFDTSVRRRSRLGTWLPFR